MEGKMEKKKAPTTSKKRTVGKPPTLAERITDFSTDGMTNIRYIPKKKTGK